jgi:hypothetical protein
MLRVIKGIFLGIGIPFLGYFVFWRDFKKQKRIENLNNNVKEALQILPRIEQDIHELRLSCGQNISDAKHDKFQKNIIINLDLLKNSLLLITKNENLLINEKILIFKEFINKLNKISLHKHKNCAKSFSSIDFLAQLDFLDEDTRTIAFFENIRQELIKIYNMQ